MDDDGEPGETYVNPDGLDVFSSTPMYTNKNSVDGPNISYHANLVSSHRNSQSITGASNCETFIYDGRWPPSSIIQSPSEYYIELSSIVADKMSLSEDGRKDLKKLIS